MFIAVIFAVVLVEPKYKEIVAVSEAIVLKEKELEGQRFLVREVDNISKEFDPVLKKLSIFDELVPKSVNLADLLFKIDYLASRNGLVITEVDFSDPVDIKVKKGKYKVVKAKMKLAGSYESFLNFSDDIKNSKQLMDIVEFTVEGKAVEDPATNKISIGDVFDFSVTINSYYQ